MQQNENCTKHNSEIIHVCINDIASLTPTTPPPQLINLKLIIMEKWILHTEGGGDPGLFWGYGLYVNNHHRQDLQIDNNANLFVLIRTPNP